MFLVGSARRSHAVDDGRARPHPRVALRLRRAVLPPRHAHRLRLPFPAEPALRSVPETSASGCDHSARIEHFIIFIVFRCRVAGRLRPGTAGCAHREGVSAEWNRTGDQLPPVLVAPVRGAGADPADRLRDGATSVGRHGATADRRWRQDGRGAARAACSARAGPTAGRPRGGRAAGRPAGRAGRPLPRRGRRSTSRWRPRAPSWPSSPHEVADACRAAGGARHRPGAVHRRRRHARPPRRRPPGPASPVVRAMPNTPAVVGAGASAIAAGRHRHRGRPRLGRVGARGRRRRGAGLGGPARRRHRPVRAPGRRTCSWWPRASSRPACWSGCPATSPEVLAVQTLLGSAELLRSRTSTTRPLLRAAVTSPGGTTAAGLHALEAGRAGRAHRRRRRRPDRAVELA